MVGTKSVYLNYLRDSTVGLIKIINNSRCEGASTLPESSVPEPSLGAKWSSMKSRDTESNEYVLYRGWRTQRTFLS